MADELADSVPDVLRRGPVLIGVVAVLALLATVGTVFVLGGGVDELVWGLAGGIAATVAVVGAYLVGRRYGQSHSHAFATAGVVFGVVLLAAVVAELLHSAGELSNAEIGLGLGGAVVVTIVLIGAVAALDRATAA